MQEIIKKYNLPLLKFGNVTRHLLYQDVSSCNIFNNMLWLQVHNTWLAWYKYSTSSVAALPISVITKLGYILLHFSFPLAKGQTILYFDSGHASRQHCSYHQSQNQSPRTRVTQAWAKWTNSACVQVCSVQYLLDQKYFRKLRPTCSQFLSILPIWQCSLLDWLIPI